MSGSPIHLCVGYYGHSLIIKQNTTGSLGRAVYGCAVLLKIVFCYSGQWGREKFFDQTRRVKKNDKAIALTAVDMVMVERGWSDSIRFVACIYVFKTCDGLVNFPCVRQLQLRTSAASLC
jgi:hypothetical protein